MTTLDSSFPLNKIRDNSTKPEDDYSKVPNMEFLTELGSKNYYDIVFALNMFAKNEGFQYTTRRGAPRGPNTKFKLYCSHSRGTEEYITNCPHWLQFSWTEKSKDPALAPYALIKDLEILQHNHKPEPTLRLAKIIPKDKILERKYKRRATRKLNHEKKMNYRKVKDLEEEFSDGDLTEESEDGDDDDEEEEGNANNDDELKSICDLTFSTDEEESGSDNDNHENAQDSKVFSKSSGEGRSDIIASIKRSTTTQETSLEEELNIKNNKLMKEMREVQNEMKKIQKQAKPIEAKNIPKNLKDSDCHCKGKIAQLKNKIVKMENQAKENDKVYQEKFAIVEEKLVKVENERNMFEKKYEGLKTAIREREKLIEEEKNLVEKKRKLAEFESSI